MRVSLVLAASLCVASATAHADTTLYAGVAAAVKAALGKNVGLVAEMSRHLRRLRLLDDKGAFAVPALVNKGLLAPLDANAFIDKAVGCAAANPYLNAFVKAAQGASFQLGKRGDAAQVLTSAVAYAAVLDRLVRVMRDDWRILDALRAHWAAAKKGINLLKVMNAFEVAKMLTVESTMAKYVEFHKKKRVPADRGAIMLPLNVMEAVLEDTRLGFIDNARTGMTLAVNPPGSTRYDPRTQAGPTKFSADGKMILYSFPFPQKWADLYVTWNLAFCSHYPDFPLFFAKLFAPMVACYQAEPRAYIYNRALGLYTHLYRILFARADKEPKSDWSEKALTKLWAKVNAASAGKYDAAVAKANPSLANQIKKLLGKAHQFIRENPPAKIIRTIGNKVKGAFRSFKKKLGF